MSISKRTRLLIQGTVVAFVMVFSWIGMLVGLQYISSSDAGPAFRQETEDLLTKIREGKDLEIYNDASPLFRATILKEDFVQRLTDIRKVLGPYKRVLNTNPLDEINGPRGRTASAEARIEFVEGTTMGQFSFHLVGERWLLLGLRIDVPEPLQQRMPKGKEFLARHEPPPEVLAAAKSIMAQVRDGEGGRVWDDASEPFRDSTEQKKRFLDILAKRRSILGRYLRVLEVPTAFQNRRAKEASVIMVVQYEKTQAQVRMDFIRFEDAWKLLGYKVQIPLPLAPSIKDPHGP